MFKLVAYSLYHDGIWHFNLETKSWHLKYDLCRATYFFGSSFDLYSWMSDWQKTVYGTPWVDTKSLPYISMHAISHRCFKFNGILTNPLLKFVNRWVITYHHIAWLAWFLIHAQMYGRVARDPVLLCICMVSISTANLLTTRAFKYGILEMIYIYIYTF